MKVFGTSGFVFAGLTAIAVGGVALGVVDDTPNTLQISPGKVFAQLLNEALPQANYDVGELPGNWTEIHGAVVGGAYGMPGLVVTCETGHIFGGGRMGPIDTFKGCTVAVANHQNIAVGGEPLAHLSLKDFVSSLAEAEVFTP